MVTCPHIFVSRASGAFAFRVGSGIKFCSHWSALISTDLSHYERLSSEDGEAGA